MFIMFSMQSLIQNKISCQTNETIISFHRIHTMTQIACKKCKYKERIENTSHVLSHIQGHHIQLEYNQFNNTFKLRYYMTTLSHYTTPQFLNHIYGFCCGHVKYRPIQPPGWSKVKINFINELPSSIRTFWCVTHIPLSSILNFHF